MCYGSVGGLFAPGTAKYEFIQKLEKKKKKEEEFWLQRSKKAL